ncbi:hypothetical protein V6N11_030775 [Hibiscus sabdariffa]|uniref:Uncharacterized protein n=1 Tax=Hibiscus sabdariffa TaxID=183260 RepID=A0ABR2N779_9ROSI
MENIITKGNKNVEECYQAYVVEKVNRYEQTASEHWRMNMEDGHLDLPDLLANVTYCLLHCGLFMMVSCMHEHLDSRQVELDSNCLEAVNILNAKSMVMKDSALVGCYGEKVVDGLAQLHFSTHGEEAESPQMTVSACRLSHRDSDGSGAGRERQPGLFPS